MPDLKIKLQQAGMSDRPEEFVKKTIVGSAFMGTGIIAFLTLILLKTNVGSLWWYLGAPLLFLILFFYLIKLPDAKISRIQKEISKEIVFAGRFLIIELESGVPIYTAFQNLGNNYPFIGSYTKEIVHKMDLGTSLEEAIGEAIELTPSDDFRKLMWQVTNSLGTGSEVSQALSSIVDQIAKRQGIEVSRYGKKLNPLAMFYMMIAVIVPSLGITMIIILSSFVNFTLTLPVLLLMALLIGFVQFMFISVVKFSRPPIEF